VSSLFVGFPLYTECRQRPPGAVWRRFLVKRVLFWILAADSPLRPCAGKREIVVLLCTCLVLCLGCARVACASFAPVCRVQVGLLSAESLWVACDELRLGMRPVLCWSATVTV
jgi:hypothetical protein